MSTWVPRGSLLARLALTGASFGLAICTSACATPSYEDIARDDGSVHTIRDAGSGDGSLIGERELADQHARVDPHPEAVEKPARASRSSVS